MLDVLGGCFVATIFVYPSIFLHELGHVLAAKLVGLRPTHLIVGESDILFQQLVGGVELVVCLVPFRGLAVVAESQMSRFQAVTFAMAGPLANAAVALALVLAWPYFAHHLTLGALFVMQLVIAGANLVPQDWQYEGRLVPNDGKIILTCFRKRANQPSPPSRSARG
jgi:membrane-associated protease RseP (regulator of RpoE activity)